jgi:hypothetical protein
MLDYLKIASDIDAIADKIEGFGCVREALALDKIADTLELLRSVPPEALSMARELGLNLNNPQAVLEFIAKNLNSGVSGGPGSMESKEALNVGPKVRQYAMLAMLLANAFISSAQAKGGPVTVMTPQGPSTYSIQQVKHIKDTNPGMFAEIMKDSKIFETLADNMLKDAKGKGSITINYEMGPKTYKAQDLEDLRRGDPKSFAIAAEKYDQQSAQAQSVSEISQSNQGRAQNAPKPGDNMKPVKNIEELSDAFGNEGRLITYTDGSKSMEGDIYQGGVSLRDRLTRSGEIAPDPSAESLPRR